jgi:hypothetical protein
MHALPKRRCHRRPYALLNCSNSRSTCSSSDAEVITLVVAAASPLSVLTVPYHSCGLCLLTSFLIVRFIHVREHVHVLLEAKTPPKFLPFIQTSAVLGPASGREPGQAKPNRPGQVKVTACGGFWPGLRFEKPRPGCQAAAFEWQMGHTLGSLANSARDFLGDA